MDEIYKQYKDMFREAEPEQPLCLCNALQLPDESNTYLVCTSCGQCLDTIRHNEVDYSDQANFVYVARRHYSRSGYLRSKLNRLLLSKKDVLPDDKIQVVKKKIKQYTLSNLIKIMKKKKWMKYDPVKTLFTLKGMRPLTINDVDINRLVHTFNRKEKVYRDHNYKRFNYNFVLQKIFEEWGRYDLLECVKALQDSSITLKHEEVYKYLFP